MGGVEAVVGGVGAGVGGVGAGVGGVGAGVGGVGAGVGGVGAGVGGVGAGVGNTVVVDVVVIKMQAMPVKTPLVPHVQLPPPSYPKLQVTATVAPVFPVILRLAIFEKGTFAYVHEFALHVGTADHALEALATPLQVIELEPERV